jgi:Cellulase (glycosyl hydrolase family 5)/Glycoside hydrolase family 5 C-terminal domain
MGKTVSLILAACLLVCLAACDDDYDIDDQFDDSLTMLHTQDSFFKDEYGRFAFLNGINVSGSAKVPTTTSPISYVGKPFAVEEMDKHFRIIRDLGFNSVRLLVIWEAIEPEAKGQYDTEYLDYIEQVVSKAEEYGIYVIVDMHQDMFSRHLFVLYDDGTNVMGLTDESEIALASSHGFNNRLGGDGAPRWVIEACLPNKNVGGPKWGLPLDMAGHPRETSNVLPFTTWFINIGTSIDINRCYATLFAGDKLYPNYFIDGVNVKDYLQDAYADAFVQVAERVGHYPNVIGYDIMNEPGGIYIALSLQVLIWDLLTSSAKDSLSFDQAQGAFDAYLADLMDQGLGSGEAEWLREIFADYDLIPNSVEDILVSGFIPEKADSPYMPDSDAVLRLNINTNRETLQPFFQRVGLALQEADPDAVIFIEEARALLPDKGMAGFMAYPMTAPEGLRQIAFAPHGYTDIYPFIGFNAPPRDFTVDEVRFRDYHTVIEEAIALSEFSLGDAPVVFGEFGTYFNFGGIEKSLEENYLVSSTILDPYYEAFDELAMHRFLWCYSPENTPTNGEGWNKEDFSILDFVKKPRSWEAYSRTVARYTSGRIRHMHFYSPLHYFEPHPNTPTPYLEFVLEIEAKETDAATEIFVPPLQYEEGFYVHISDGRCAYDPERYILYWWPFNDDPEAVHNIRIHPPYGDQNNTWDYFFHNDTVIEGAK